MPLRRCQCHYYYYLQRAHAQNTQSFLECSHKQHLLSTCFHILFKSKQKKKSSVDNEKKERKESECFCQCKRRNIFSRGSSSREFSFEIVISAHERVVKDSQMYVRSEKLLKHVRFSSKKKTLQDVRSLVAFVPALPFTSIQPSISYQLTFSVCFFL